VSLLAKVQKAADGYSIEINHREWLIMTSALRWANTLITSDAAFVDYVGCPRPEFAALMAELTESYKNLGPQ
jgi:hypothetical protein